MTNSAIRCCYLCMYILKVGSATTNEETSVCIRMPKCIQSYHRKYKSKRENMAFIEITVTSKKTSYCSRHTKNILIFAMCKRIL